MVSFTSKLIDVDKSTIKSLVKPGLIFFAISVFHVIGYNSDNFIISSRLGSSSVAMYGVVQKTTLIAFLFWTFTSSLWPAYSEAIARKDYPWIKKTVVRTLVINLILGIAVGVLLISFGSWGILFWTDGKLDPPLSLLIGFSVYIVVNGLVGCFAIIYNSSSINRWQLLLIVFTSFSSIFIKMYLCERFGITGVIWGTVICYTLFYLLPSMVIIDRLFFRKFRTS